MPRERRRGLRVPPIAADGVAPRSIPAGAVVASAPLSPDAEPRTPSAARLPLRASRRQPSADQRFGHRRQRVAQARIESRCRFTVAAGGSLIDDHDG